MKWLRELVEVSPRRAAEPDSPQVSPQRPRGVLLARGAVGAGALTLGIAAASSATRPVQGFVALLAYLLVSALVVPRPDLSNLGWAGGLIDNPFRLSDDVNRFKAFWKVVLWPGRLVVTSMRDGLRALVA